MNCCVVDENHGMPRNFITKKETGVYICRTCGCIMADISFLHEQYEDETYYTMAHKTKSDIEDEWGFRWRYILGEIRGISDSISLLDVGAGNGYFVDLACREFGFEAVGIEISKEEVEFAKEIFNVNLIMEDVAQHREQYDVITSFNVLEHVVDPQSFLNSLVDRLKPGGVLILTTPSPACIHARVFGLKRWNMIDPPHHINLFTKEALELLFQAGQLIRIRYTTLSTYINFVRAFDTQGLLLRKLFFYALKALNLGADHFVALKKR